CCCRRRASAPPRRQAAVRILGPSIEALRKAIDEVDKHLAEPGTAYVSPNLSEVESALAAIEHQMEEMRARGETRDLPMDDIIRLMAFDFALGQLRLNLRDI